MNTRPAPAGWHPDPSNPDAALRWWDGSAWTTHTHATDVTEPPVTAHPATAWPGGSATITPDFGPSERGKLSRPMKWPWSSSR